MNKIYLGDAEYASFDGFEMPEVFPNGEILKTIYKKSGKPVLVKNARELTQLIMLLRASETKGRNWLPGRNENGWWFAFEEAA
jgi:hypothetical protein